jgi:hypothetical protein
VADELLPVARKSLWAHLRRLAEQGRARSDDPDDPDASWLSVSGERA